MTSSAQLIVCEKKGNWATALRWHQQARPLPIQETRSLIDARNALMAAPASILALEATPANLEGVIRLMYEARRNWPECRVIILLSLELATSADLFREFGATWVVQSLRRTDRVVRLVERILALQDPPELTTRERVWARLPW
jgi:hypothetical protein